MRKTANPGAHFAYIGCMGKEHRYTAGFLAGTLVLIFASGALADRTPRAVVAPLDSFAVDTESMDLVRSVMEQKLNEAGIEVAHFELFAGELTADVASRLQCDSYFEGRLDAKGRGGELTLTRSQVGRTMKVTARVTYRNGNELGRSVEQAMDALVLWSNTTGDYNSGKATIGTGPYKFVEWVPADRLIFVKNPDYWGKMLPKYVCNHDQMLLRHHSQG